MKSLAVLSIPFIVVSPVAGEVARVGHAEVTYEGIDPAQAEALAGTLDAAWKVYTEDFGFKMPQKLICSVECGRGKPTRLYTDGEDRLYLSLPSKSKLAKPATSGVFNLYGMCHELGHIAMYRVLKDRDWMTTAAAEGWAHYAGSAVVDRVWAAQGESLWADPYDYRADGLTRLHAQLASASPSKIARGAGAWEKLEQIIGRKGFPRLFAAWQNAKVDPSEPKAALLEALTGIQPDRKEPLTQWWESSAGLLVQAFKKSAFEAESIPLNRLTGHPVVLALDDDSSDGKKSIAGGGQARRFASPGPGQWYIRSVSVYGSRYGHPRPPAEQFDLALCDEKMAPIAVWKQRYGTFHHGGPRWVRMNVPPTRVPPSFYVCLNFRPTGTKGVFVHYDASTNGDSLVATPGRPGEPFGQGDWMIRIALDQPKEADALEADDPPADQAEAPNER